MPEGGEEGEVPPLADAQIREIREASLRFRSGTLAHAEAKVAPRGQRFSTWSGIEVPDLVTPADISVDYLRDLSFPGEFPYTRGVQPNMYRGKLWTLRQFAGFGTPAQTNQRFRYLLDRGQTGLSTAFDFPTLMGYDSDSPRALGEVGVCGVAVDTLDDMTALFDGIPLDQVTTSMTINGPAVVLLAFYAAAADRRSIPRAALGGTIQNDCLKEFIAQHAWLVPPRPAMRVVCDMIEFCSREMPRWNPVSISGYHIREAGSTAAQELAFTLADGLEYCAWCTRRGMHIDSFAPRLSFFFDVHNDFFEEICKLRAARRIWAREVQRRFGARKPESMKLRTHAQTAGVSLTAQQPLNNVARVALQAAAAVLGGTQSLHTNSLDETYALPTEQAVTIAVRTQQIIAHESGLANTVDPLGGSYYVEWLTGELERQALDYIARIDALGGMVHAIEQGYPQREIAAAAYRFAREAEAGTRTTVGVNAFAEAEGQTSGVTAGLGEASIQTLKIDPALARAKIEALRAFKLARPGAQVQGALRDVRAAASSDTNLMPVVIAAASSSCTLQEICDVLRDVLGAHTDPAEF